MQDNQNATPHSELLSSQSNAEKDPNKLTSLSEIVERIEVDKTPFHIVGNKEIGYFLTLGKYRLTETFHTPDQVEEHLKIHHWDVIVTLMTTLAHAVLDLREENS